MAHSLARWRDRIRAVSLEYSAVRVALDWLLAADAEDVHDVAEAGGNNDPHLGAIYQADESLAATYFVRMFAQFEMAVKSYWRSRPGSPRENPDVVDAIDDLGAELRLAYDLIDEVQRIRRLRNDLIHDWNRAQVVSVDLAGELNRLIGFLNHLPRTWP